MRRNLGIVFLIAAVVAAVLTYVTGSSLSDAVGFAPMARWNIFFALSTPVCVLIAMLLLRSR